MSATGESREPLAPPLVTVVLVDNGSTDGAASRARDTYGNRLRYIRNDDNLGFAMGNNQGFEAARGEWVFLLNNDAVAGRWCADSARWASSGRHVDHRDRRRVMISM